MSNPKDLVGANKAALRYVPPALMIEASGPMEDGAMKYGPFNWREQPVEVLTYIEAVFRHLYAFLDGQDNAEDSGHSHIGHAISGLGIIADAKANGTLIDNRFSKGPAADMLRERDKSKPIDITDIIDEWEKTSGWKTNFIPKVTYMGMDLSNREDVSVQIENWGTGDGPIIVPGEQIAHSDGWFAQGSSKMYLGEPTEASDGCVEYRGRHIHWTVATPDVFAEIDKEWDRLYDPLDDDGA